MPPKVSRNKTTTLTTQVGAKTEQGTKRPRSSTPPPPAIGQQGVSDSAWKKIKRARADRELDRELSKLQATMGDEKVPASTAKTYSNIVERLRRDLQKAEAALEQANEGKSAAEWKAKHLKTALENEKRSYITHSYAIANHQIHTYNIIRQVLIQDIQGMDLANAVPAHAEFKREDVRQKLTEMDKDLKENTRKLAFLTSDAGHDAISNFYWSTSCEHHLPFLKDGRLQPYFGPGANCQQILDIYDSSWYVWAILRFDTYFDILSQVL
jgi:hypothetical protein